MPRPTPETADYMIGMAAKDSEQKAVEGARRSGDKVRRAFWTQVLEALRERDTTLFQNVNPSGQYWLSCSTGLSGCDYSLLFAKKEVRVEVELKRSKGENKWLFDRLEQQRADVEADFGEGLNWLRMDDKKASRIVFARDFDGFDEANWPDMVDWLCEHILRLEQAFSEPLGRLNRQLKSGIDQAVAGGAAAEGLAAAD